METPLSARAKHELWVMSLNKPKLQEIVKNIEMSELEQASVIANLRKACKNLRFQIEQLVNANKKLEITSKSYKMTVDALKDMLIELQRGERK